MKNLIRYFLIFFPIQLLFIVHFLGANRSNNISENSPQATPAMSAATAMEKISAMIPPPPIDKTKQNVSDEEEEDDDWE